MLSFSSILNKTDKSFFFIPQTNYSIIQIITVFPLGACYRIFITTLNNLKLMFTPYKVIYFAYNYDIHDLHVSCLFSCRHMYPEPLATLQSSIKILLFWYVLVNVKY